MLPEFDEIENFGHGVVLATAVGTFLWIVAAALFGWIA